MGMVLYLNEAKQAIKDKFYILQEKELEHCVQLKLNNGGVINCYNTGTCVINGKNSNAVKQVISEYLENQNIDEDTGVKFTSQLIIDDIDDLPF